AASAWFPIRPTKEKASKLQTTASAPARATVDVDLDVPSVRAATTSSAPQKRPAKPTAGSSQSQSTAACAAKAAYAPKIPATSGCARARIAATIGKANAAATKASPTTPSSANVSR